MTSRVALVTCVLAVASSAHAQKPKPDAVDAKFGNATANKGAATAKHEVTFDDAKKLFPTAPKSCTDIACLIEDGYSDDAKAKELALGLHRDVGDVAGVGPEEIMDGGYRGKIHLVPELPKGKYRQHIEWVSTARKAIDAFFVELFDGQPQPNYRWRALALRFVRSVGKKTPSAYAFAWVIEYNVEGSLMRHEAGVRETLFHELFHNNDYAHGDWSANTLQADYDAIVKKCGTKVRCLDPYAPNSTKVRGGTYYAFQPNNGNGVHEYAAELAVRYWKEHTEMLKNKKLSKAAFKCGPPENARSWKAIVDEMFGGRDLIPDC